MSTDGNPVQAKVKLPAILLMVTAGIGLALVLCSLAVNVAGMAGGTAAAATTKTDDPMAQLQAQTSGIPSLISGLISLATGGLMIYGAMQMMNLKSYGLAMTASILALLPCITPCCLITLPFGVWCLIVLNNAEVKAAFR